MLSAGLLDVVCSTSCALYIKAEATPNFGTISIESAITNNFKCLLDASRSPFTTKMMLFAVVDAKTTIKVGPLGEPQDHHIGEVGEDSAAAPP